MSLPVLARIGYTEIILFYCIGGAVVMYGTFFMLRKFWPNLIVEEVDSDFIAGLHAAIFTITFLTLGYCLVNASDTVDEYEQNVIAEANDIKSLDILLSLYSEKGSDQLRADLRDYADSIVETEWPLLAKRMGSEETLNYQRKFRADLTHLKPISGKELIIYSQILEITSKVIQARSTRIGNSDNRLAPQFMLASNIGYLCVLIISALMLTQFTWFRFISLNIQIFAVSFIFASTISLDNPYKGENRISSEPIATIAQTLNTNPKVVLP